MKVNRIEVKHLDPRLRKKVKDMCSVIEGLNAEEALNLTLNSFFMCVQNLLEQCEEKETREILKGMVQEQMNHMYKAIGRL